MIHHVAAVLLVSVCMLGAATAQECGPNCPVCSGVGEAAGGVQGRPTLVTSVLYIPEGEEETGVANARYRVTQWLDVGLGYAFDAEEPIWGVQLYPFSEDQDSFRPGLILGTGCVGRLSIESFGVSITAGCT
ncbi:hypothetical protein ACFL6M_01860 [Candidatus Eisenbacteria bacterium]|uniref:Transporter n=1 Tax=Eiseniibacteriota bacterium TaxID=2212470 RepID=A0ABV6YJ02_UNCEI